MEVRIGDRRMSNSDDFPEHITPFPESRDSGYEHSAPVTSPSPEIKDSTPYFPPQKLRPIRSNGKNPLEYSDHLMNTQRSELLEDGCGGLSVLGAAAAAPGVGFLGTQLREFCRDTLSGGSGCYLTEKCGAVAEDGLWTAAETMAALQDVRSTFETGFGNVKYEGGVSETETSSSSDYSGNSLKNNPVNRKRKRRTKKKLEMFMENLAAKVMQKQEQMHSQLIQIIQMKEKERILREEAWKQQEMERAKREEQVRAQETSRNLAIISFIQNILGNGFQFPKPLQTVYVEGDEDEVHDQRDVKYNQTDERSPKFESHQKDDTNDTNDRRWSETEVQNRYDVFSKRWPKSEVQALIAVRTALDHKFHSMGVKGSIWEEISVGLASMGYNRTAKKCKEKWENMNKYFKKTIEGGKMRSENAKTCPYFQELEILYNAGLNNPANGVNNRSDENGDKSAMTLTVHES